MNFDAYVSVDHELKTCGVLCVEEMCGELGSGSNAKEGQSGGGGDNEAKPEPVPSFTEALNSSETMMSAHICSHH
jgi:hypothetical protein